MMYDNLVQVNRQCTNDLRPALYRRNPSYFRSVLLSILGNHNDRRTAHFIETQCQVALRDLINLLSAHVRC